MFIYFEWIFCGLVVWLIENYSSYKNTKMKVEYIDAWFVSISCVYNCGLTSMDFAKLSTISQVILMIFTVISDFTISTLPVLIVKAYTHRRVEGIIVDDYHNELPTFNIRSERIYPKIFKINFENYQQHHNFVIVLI